MSDKTFLVVAGLVVLYFVWSASNQSNKSHNVVVIPVPSPSVKPPYSDEPYPLEPDIPPNNPEQGKTPVPCMVQWEWAPCVNGKSKANGTILRYPRYGGKACPSSLVYTDSCDEDLEGYRAHGPGRPRRGLVRPRAIPPIRPLGCPPCNC